VEIQRMYWR